MIKFPKESNEIANHSTNFRVLELSSDGILKVVHKPSPTVLANIDKSNHVKRQTAFHHEKKLLIQILKLELIFI